MDDNMDRLLRYDYITATSIRNVIKQIDAYQREWKVKDKLSADQLAELRHLATVQSIGSSTRIEGSKLQDEEVADLIKHMEIQKLESRDEQEVAGYFTVLEIIQEQFEDMKLSVNLIKGLHNELMRYSVKDEFHRGKYKQLSNQVVATDGEGNQKIIFQTTSPMQTEQAMEDAINWLNETLDKGSLHPLEAIAAFVYEFLTIHPFQDGNGRLSRLLTNLLLFRAGYEFLQYASLESIVEQDKAAYYKSLMVAQRYRGKDEEQIGRFVYFLLSSIRKLTSRLEDDEEAIVEEPEALYLNKRQRQVFDFIKKDGVLSIKEIDTLLPQVSRNTLKYDLSKLTEEGLLVRKGKGRGTVYEAAKR